MGKFRKDKLKANIKKYHEIYNFPGEKERVKADYEFLPVNNDFLFFQCFTPESYQYNILILHGYFDHAGMLSEFIRYLTESKGRVFIIDLPGHGLSTGEQYVIEDFTYYQKVLYAMDEQMKQYGAGKYHVIGHSTGGGISVQHVLTKPDHQFESLTLIAPLARSSKWHLSKAGHSLISPLVKEVPRKIRTDKENPELSERIKEDPLHGPAIPLCWLEAMFEWEKEMRALEPSQFPVHIIQGNMDKTVDWKYNLRFLEKKFPNAFFYLVDQGGHHLLNERDSIKHMVFSLITKKIISKAEELTNNMSNK
ncbi:alpha/beta hydrolase [Bacillus sp. FJAT-44742]|uniref:alpha/beta hydrolase n=1 Tax=Bacillus sp. FJAT-44742 TaxID=2014005 RepID=UPI000C23D38E|nr:alpha/beta hydrolase [Bacillus sp. FJAT-44742]